MNCHDFQALLQQRLDGTEPESPRAYEEHLRSCPDCAALDGAARCLVEGLRLMTPPAPPASLARQTLSRVLKQRRRRRGRRRVVVPLAVAACLLVAILARLYWVPAPTPPRSQPEPVARPQEPPPEPVGIRESVAEAGQAVASWTKGRAEEAVSEARWLMPRVETKNLMTPELEPPARTLRQAGAGVRAGLEPVKDSARRAVDLFFREVPMDLGEDRGS